jgi:hypothetical protein
MAYLGQQPVVGRYILLDQISGGFNGTASGFTMSTAAGAQGVIPGLAQNVLLSLGGVIQQPGVDYTISGSGLTFTTPPVSGTTFFATVLGDAQSVGTPSDGTVTPASIASGYDFVFPNLSVTGVHTIASGTAAIPSLTITGDTDTGLFSPAANVLAITTSGSAALTVSGSNVGVGTSSPAGLIHASGGVAIVNNVGDTGAIKLAGGGSWNTITSSAGSTSSTAKDLAVFLGSSEAARIDSSGRLLVGLSSTMGRVAGINGGQIQLEGTTLENSALQLYSNADNQLISPSILFGRSRGTDIGGDTIVQDDDRLGFIAFSGADGVDRNTSAALIEAYVDGAPEENDIPGRLVFSTTAVSQPTSTARMTILSDGNVGIGTTDPGTILDVRQTQTGGETKIRVFNTDTADTTTQTASIGLSPDSRASAVAGIEAIKVNADFSTNTGRDVALALNTTLNNAKNQAVYITHGGNVGIGTEAPAVQLSVGGVSGTGVQLKTADSNFSALNIGIAADHTFIGSTAAGTGTVQPLAFDIGASEAARIDSSGRLLVGTVTGYVTSTSPTLQPLLQIHNTGLNQAQISINSWATGTDTGPSLSLCRSDSGTIGDFGSAVGSTDVLGNIRFSGSDGGEFIEGAKITASANGTWGDDDGPTKLIFYTRASGATDPTERVTIYANGSVEALGIYNTNIGGTTRDVYVEDSGQLGYITSIQAAKGNISSLEDVGWLYSLNPVSFNYKVKDNDGNYTDNLYAEKEYGLIAEEVEQSAPELCFYDEVDEQLELRGVHYRKLITPMLKALQQANERIEQLEAKVAALEA